MKKTKMMAEQAADPSRPAEPSLRRALWPDEFASPRMAIVLGALLALVTAGLLTLGVFDGFNAVKIVLAWMLGLSRPELVQPGSWDAVGVAWGLFAMFCAGIIHPSLGLIVLALLRPWLDGFTYPTDNCYFVWGIVFLAALWGLRMFTRNEPVRYGAANALLAAFCAVALATAAGSIQFDRTYRGLVLWFSYLLLFFVTTNSIRSRKTFGIVLTGMMVAVAAQTWFSILHFEYILSFLRRSLMEDRMLRLQFFGEDRFGPDLIDRFNVNRAFGSMLHPNALAGFLILGIPYAVSQGLFGWRALLAVWRATPVPRGDEQQRRRAMAIAGGVWLLCAVTLFVTALFPITYAQTAQGDAPVYEAAVFSVVLALAPAVLFGWIAYARGVLVCGHCLRVSGLSALAVIELFALWITYSRGGILALLAASLWGAFLYAGAGWRNLLPSKLRKAVPAVVAVLLIAGGITWIGHGVAMAQSNPEPAAASALASVPPAPTAAGTSTAPAPPTAAETGPALAPAMAPAEDTGAPLDQLREEGTSVTLKKLMNPATMGLRWSYWVVGVTMLFHHFWTGVGLGDFGVAYPIYQYLGAGNVTQAHNAYLQAACETGIFGGLLLLFFCGYLVLWGARRIRREKDRSERLTLTALYVGMLAFLLHSFIDVHFSHPSLMMLWMLFAGLFLARAGLGGQEEKTGRSGAWPQMIAIPILLLAALTLGMSMRVYLHDLSIGRISFINVSKTDPLELRYQTARYVFNEVTWYGLNPKPPKPRLPVVALQSLIADKERIGILGPAFAPLPDSSNGVRRIQPGQEIPQDAIILIDKPWNVTIPCRKGAVDYVRELEMIDRRFPYCPDLAMHLCEWYKLFAEAFQEKEKVMSQSDALARMMVWAEEAVKRSPLHADMHLNYAQSLWTHGTLQPPEARLDDFVRALDEFQRASVLSPNTPAYLQQYAEALEKVGQSIRTAGDETRAEPYLKQADEANARLEQLKKERERLRIW